MRTEQIFHRDTGLLEIVCGYCGHEYKVEGDEVGGHNPFQLRHPRSSEEPSFIYGSSADYCDDCDNYHDNPKLIKVGRRT